MCIRDRLQVAATAATPASALLLIVRLTPDAALLRSLREQAEAHGIDAVVEIFDEADLALARESGARIIQVNARDLDTLQVDRSACLRLAAVSYTHLDVYKRQVPHRIEAVGFAEKSRFQFHSVPQ